MNTKERKKRGHAKTEDGIKDLTSRTARNASRSLTHCATRNVPRSEAGGRKDVRSKSDELGSLLGLDIPRPILPARLGGGSWRRRACTRRGRSVRGFAEVLNRRCTC